MKMSERGRKLLKQREGVVLRAYRDSVGVLTIGCGHTSAAGPPVVTTGMSITAEQSDQILARDLIAFEKVINDALKITVTQNEFDALVSVCFNVGPRFATSTCIKRLNMGDRAGAAEAIMMWNIPSEIIKRRRSEYTQFKTPYAKADAKKTTGAVVGGAIATGTTIGAAHTQGVSNLTIALICVGIVTAGVIGYFIWKRFR